MKKSSLLVILVPVMVALMVVAIVGAKRFQLASTPTVTIPSVVVSPTPGVPSLTGKTGAPTTGFSGMSAKPVSDLRKSFEATDYSDTSDLDGLSKDVSAL